MHTCCKHFTQLYARAPVAMTRTHLRLRHRHVGLNACERQPRLHPQPQSRWFPFSRGTRASLFSSREPPQQQEAAAPDRRRQQQFRQHDGKAYECPSSGGTRQRNHSVCGWNGDGAVGVWEGEVRVRCMIAPRHGARRHALECTPPPPLHTHTHTHITYSPTNTQTHKHMHTHTITPTQTH
jgi:hypothetical protein